MENTNLKKPNYVLYIITIMLLIIIYFSILCIKNFSAFLDKESGYSVVVSVILLASIIGFFIAGFKVYFGKNNILAWLNLAMINMFMSIPIFGLIMKGQNITDVFYYGLNYYEAIHGGILILLRILLYILIVRNKTHTHEENKNSDTANKKGIIYNSNRIKFYTSIVFISVVYMVTISNIFRPTINYPIALMGLSGLLVGLNIFFIIHYEIRNKNNNTYIIVPFIYACIYIALVYIIGYV